MCPIPLEVHIIKRYAVIAVNRYLSWYSIRPSRTWYIHSNNAAEQRVDIQPLNMQLCHEAVSRQSAFCHHLQRTTLPETSYMFLLEKSMMDMVVSELSEGCVYGVLFCQGHMHYLHFFESGIFSGFFESRDPAYHVVIQDKIQL